MQKPKISIVTITYNCEKTLEETILSVISQQYDNLEYIIVDGLSTDNTLSIINKYKSHINAFISEKDNGISDAFNKGIKISTGDLIGILNSDDVMMPNALNEIAKHYDGETEVYRGHTMIWNAETGMIFREIPSMRFPLIPINIKCSHQGTFVTPEAYKKYGLYRTDIKHPMDLELLRRFYRLGAKMKYMDVDVAKFRMGGVTGTPMVQKKQEYKNIVLFNGGNEFQASLYYAYLRTIDIIKKILTAIGGEDLKRSLRYKKMNNKKDSLL